MIKSDSRKTVVLIRILCRPAERIISVLRSGGYVSLIDKGYMEYIIMRIIIVMKFVISN